MGARRIPLILLFLEFIHYTIGAELMNCNFDVDGTCDDLSLIAGDVFKWYSRQADTASFNTGPSADHTTGDASGFYWYTEASSGTQGDTTELQTSALYSNTGSACLSFWYHMKGASIGTLSVNYQQTEVFTVSGEMEGDAWIYKTVNLPLTGATEFSLSFVGTRGSSFTGDIAIDDVKVTDSACSSVSNIYFDCDFEQACSMLSNFIDQDNFEWHRQVCCTGTPSTGPSFDHTLGTQSGNFLYTEATNYNGFGSGLARTQTEPAILPASNQACISFWYHMYGSQIGYLSVLFMETGEADQEIFREIGGRGDSWIQFSQTLSTSVGVRFNIRFDVGYGGGPLGDVAIDDVIIYDGPCEGWTEWSSWSTCSRTCGTGQQTRSRTCSGSNCEGEAEESRDCNTESCPVWGPWSSYSSCTRECGGGTQTRNRECIGTGTCVGDSQQQRDCNTHSCDGWTPWSSWGSCSRTCGGGTQTRYRTCDGPSSSCPGDDQGARDCNIQACPGPRYVVGKWYGTMTCGGTTYDYTLDIVSEGTSGFRTATLVVETSVGAKDEYAMWGTEYIPADPSNFWNRRYVVFAAISNPVNNIAALNVRAIGGYYDPNQDVTLDELEEIEFVHDSGVCTSSTATKTSICTPLEPTKIDWSSLGPLESICTASSSSNGNPCKDAIDDLGNSAWKPVGDAVGQWIRLDLKESRTLNKIFLKSIHHSHMGFILISLNSGFERRILWPGEGSHEVTVPLDDKVATTVTVEVQSLNENNIHTQYGFKAISVYEVKENPGCVTPPVPVEEILEMWYGTFVCNKNYYYQLDMKAGGVQYEAVLTIFDIDRNVGEATFSGSLTGEDVFSFTRTTSLTEHSELSSFTAFTAQYDRAEEELILTINAPSSCKLKSISSRLCRGALISLKDLSATCTATSVLKAKNNCDAAIDEDGTTAWKSTLTATEPSITITLPSVQPIYSFRIRSTWDSGIQRMRVEFDSGDPIDFDWLDSLNAFTVFPANVINSRTVKVTILQYTTEPGLKEIRLFERGPLDCQRPTSSKPGLVISTGSVIRRPDQS